MESKETPSVYDTIKKMLEYALEDLDLFGLEPVWRLKSKRPFFTDEYGKPTCYLNVGDYKVEGEEPFASILPSDIMKEENPFWGFVDELTKIKNKAASQNLLVEKQGVFVSSVSKHVQQRIWDLKVMTKPWELGILWMYFQHMGWVDCNESSFKRYIVFSVQKYQPKKEVRVEKNISSRYIQKALRKAINDRGFEDLMSREMNYNTLLQFLSKCKGRGLLNEKGAQWLAFCKDIEKIFEGIEQV